MTFKDLCVNGVVRDKVAEAGRVETVDIVRCSITVLNVWRSVLTVNFGFKLRLEIAAEQWRAQRSLDRRRS
jgi:hypothetical protein